MLEVLFFYMFVWWFKKLENKKALKIRAVLAGIFGGFSWIMSFASISLIKFEAALVVIVITCFGIAILFTVRSICDIIQISKFNIITEDKNQSNNNYRSETSSSSNLNLEINKEKSSSGSNRTQAAKKSEQDIQQYLALIGKCGIGFFIKYYRQISRLPLADVAVTENYSSAEREERLLAAKKIIDSGLSELALTEIIRAYDDILDKAVIDRAKELLDEIRKKN